MKNYGSPLKMFNDESFSFKVLTPSDIFSLDVNGQILLCDTRIRNTLVDVDYPGCSD